LSLPEKNALINFSPLPKGAFGSAPCAVGELDRRKFTGPAHPRQRMSCTKVVNESSQSPAISDCVMDGEDQQMVVRAPTDYIHAIERTLHKIKRFAESDLHQFFDRLGLPF
jgi:hypothetical protein